MIPVTWLYDPETTQQIPGRMITFVPENVVPSKALNALQDQILYLVKSLRDLAPENLLLHGDTDTRSILVEYYDSGSSGTHSADGTGAVAMMKTPVKGSDPISFIETSFTYDGAGNLTMATVTDGNVSMDIVYQYSITTGNLTGWTIQQTPV